MLASLTSYKMFIYYSKGTRKYSWTTFIFHSRSVTLQKFLIPFHKVKFTFYFENYLQYGRIFMYDTFYSILVIYFCNGNKCGHFITMPKLVSRYQMPILECVWFQTNYQINTFIVILPNFYGLHICCSFISKVHPKCERN